MNWKSTKSTMSTFALAVLLHGCVAPSGSLQPLALQSGYSASSVSFTSELQPDCEIIGQSMFIPQQVFGTGTVSDDAIRSRLQTAAESAGANTVQILGVPGEVVPHEYVATCRSLDTADLDIVEAMLANCSGN